MGEDNKQLRDESKTTENLKSKKEIRFSELALRLLQVDIIC